MAVMVVVVVVDVVKFEAEAEAEVAFKVQKLPQMAKLDEWTSLRPQGLNCVWFACLVCLSFSLSGLSVAVGQQSDKCMLRRVEQPIKKEIIIKIKKENRNWKLETGKIR